MCSSTIFKTKLLHSIIMVILNRHILPAESNSEIWTIKRTVLRNAFIDPPHLANGNMYLVKKGAVKFAYLMTIRRQF